jgi:hypothetical protein
MLQGSSVAGYLPAKVVLAPFSLGGKQASNRHCDTKAPEQKTAFATCNKKPISIM